MLTLKICVGVFSGIFKARMLKLGIHMDNELLYYGIENRTLCYYSSLYLSIFYPVFFVFVLRLLRIRVTVFFATCLLLLIYSSALLKQCSGAIVRFSDSSSYELKLMLCPLYTTAWIKGHSREKRICQGYQLLLLSITLFKEVGS